MPNESRWYRAEIEALASAHSLDPNLVEAVVRTESSGMTNAYRYEPGFWSRYLSGKPQYDGANPRRVSASYGLMQVMYPVAREYGFEDAPEYLFVPTIGLAYGCRHLSFFLKKAHGDLEKALAAYNGGWGAAVKTPFPNQSYITKVLKHLEAVRRERA